MSVEHNKLAAIEAFRLIETSNTAAAERVIAADFINREAQDNSNQRERNLPGPAGFLATGRWLCSAFSDLRFTDMEAIGEDDRVVVIATMTGRHTGDFLGVPATGKPIHQRQFHLFRFRAGKIVEHVAQRDDLGLRRQIG